MFYIIAKFVMALALNPSFPYATYGKLTVNVRPVEPFDVRFVGYVYYDHPVTKRSLPWARYEYYGVDGRVCAYSEVLDIICDGLGPYPPSLEEMDRRLEEMWRLRNGDAIEL